MVAKGIYVCVVSEYSLPTPLLMQDAMKALQNTIYTSNLEIYFFFLKLFSPWSIAFKAYSFHNFYFTTVHMQTRTQKKRRTDLSTCTKSCSLMQSCTFDCERGFQNNDQQNRN